MSKRRMIIGVVALIAAYGAVTWLAYDGYSLTHGSGVAVRAVASGCHVDATRHGRTECAGRFTYHDRPYETTVYGAHDGDHVTLNVAKSDLRPDGQPAMRTRYLVGANVVQHGWVPYAYGLFFFFWGVGALMLLLAGFALLVRRGNNRRAETVGVLHPGQPPGGR
jgi:hypothetical protein